MDTQNKCMTPTLPSRFGHVWWCGFGSNRCHILEKEWTKSDITHGWTFHFEVQAHFLWVGYVLLMLLIWLNRLPMQKKCPNPKSDLRAMYLNKSGSTFWYQIFVVCNLFLNWIILNPEVVSLWNWTAMGSQRIIFQHPTRRRLVDEQVMLIWVVGMGYTFWSKAVLGVLVLFGSSHNACLD